MMAKTECQLHLRFDADKGHTTKTTDTDDTDLLSWTDVVSDHGRVDGETGAEHRSGILGRKLLGDGKDESVVGSDSSRVTSLSHDSIGYRSVYDRVIRIGYLRKGAL